MKKTWNFFTIENDGFHEENGGCNMTIQFDSIRKKDDSLGYTWWCPRFLSELVGISR